MAPSPTRVRTILYYTIALLCMIDIACAPTSIIEVDYYYSDSPFSNIVSVHRSVDGFNLGAAVIPALQLFWIVVLLAWNNDPLNKNFLSRAKTHFVSFIVLAFLWTGSAILMTIVVAVACDPDDVFEMGRCVTAGIEVGVAWLAVAICIILSIYIPRVSKRYSTGLNTNVAIDMIEHANGSSVTPPLESGNVTDTVSLEYIKSSF
ncbi:hypothetical protein ABKN59_001429 [Abortiporus biennis]